MLRPDFITQRVSLNADNWSIDVETDPDSEQDETADIRISYKEDGEEKTYIFVPSGFIGPLIDALERFRA